MNVMIIIQARMTSTRLPGKVLMALAGKPMLQHVIERARAGLPDAKLVVATPPGEAQWPIHDLCKRLEIASESPDAPENDVLARYHHAAMNEHVNTLIVRITSDCPLLDPALLRQAVEAGGDWTTTDYVRARRAIEVFPLDVLLRAHRKATSAHDREHVCTWMYDAANGMRCVLIDDDQTNASVDTAWDLERARRVLERKAGATWNDVDTAV